MAVTHCRAWVAIIAHFCTCAVCMGMFTTKACEEATASGFTFPALQTKDFSNPEALRDEVKVLLRFMFRSETTIFVLLNFFGSLYAVSALITTAVFLGRLSERESTLLAERLIKFIVFKVVFVGAVLTPDVLELTLWLIWFTICCYMRIFMGAAKDRLDTLVVSPAATAWQHLRAVALVLLILAHDCMGVVMLLRTLQHMSSTKLLLCAFDIAVVAVDGSKTLLRYGIHVLDQHATMAMGILSQTLTNLMARRSSAAWASTSSSGSGADSSGHLTSSSSSPSGGSTEAVVWEGKGNLLYHTELVADVLMHMMTLAHYLHVWFLHGLTFHLLDALLFLDIRAVLVTMARRIRGYMRYRAATRDLNHAFPDAPFPPGSEDCTICMEPMMTAKQMPCGHCFHLACLRAWMQQSSSNSFTCPNCRQPLLLGRAASKARAAAANIYDQLQPAASPHHHHHHHHDDQQQQDQQGHLQDAGVGLLDAAADLDVDLVPAQGSGFAATSPRSVPGSLSAGLAQIMFAAPLMWLQAQAAGPSVPHQAQEPPHPTTSHSSNLAFEGSEPDEPHHARDSHDHVGTPEPGHGHSTPRSHPGHCCSHDVAGWYGAPQQQDPAVELSPQAGAADQGPAASPAAAMLLGPSLPEPSTWSGQAVSRSIHAVAQAVAAATATCSRSTAVRRRQQLAQGSKGGDSNDDAVGVVGEEEVSSPLNAYTHRGMQQQLCADAPAGASAPTPSSSSIHRRHSTAEGCSHGLSPAGQPSSMPRYHTRRVTRLTGQAPVV